MFVLSSSSTAAPLFRSSKSFLAFFFFLESKRCHYHVDRGRRDIEKRGGGKEGAIVVAFLEAQVCDNLRKKF